MKRNKGDDSEEWSVMSTEGFEMMNGTAIFSVFGCGLTHGCGTRTERRNTVVTSLGYETLMTETAICDFKNHGYYELVDVEDS